MRLLNTKTLEFREFLNEAIPKYGILSHRWRDEEVSYQDFLASPSQNSRGFTKILDACSVVRRHSRETGSNHGHWIWIDTCCINKESSAELSEAINSMWRWYQNAAMCYVYLDDVHLPSRVRASEWFTRGWTLQELLAPKDVVFFSESWTKLGTKVDLRDGIIAATGIPSSIILGEEPEWMATRSAADKISWAANRQTSRVEDMAYCLLGLLNVNIPLLYGEGNKAFLRLQQELVRTSNDESIFTWSSLKVPGFTSELSLFADSPAQFAKCGGIRAFYLQDRQAFEVTNKGLRLDTFVIPLPDGGPDAFLAPLNCRQSSGTRNVAPLGLLLLRQSWGKDLYMRGGIVRLDEPKFASAQRMLERRVRLGNGILDMLIQSRLLKFVMFFVLPFIVYTLLNMSRLFYTVVVLLPCWFYLAMTDPRLASWFRWGVTQRRVICIVDQQPAGVRDAAAYLLAQVFFGSTADMLLGRITGYSV